MYIDILPLLLDVVYCTFIGFDCIYICIYLY